MCQFHILSPITQFTKVHKSVDDKHILSLYHREETPKIGDLMKKFAPFLKLYTDYVKNFDNAMNVISMWSDKSARFAGVIESIQVRYKVLKFTLEKI